MVVTVSPVVSFPVLDIKGSSPGILVSRPWTQFATALEAFHRYAHKDYHRDAVVKAEEFLKVASNQQPSIQHLLS